MSTFKPIRTTHDRYWVTEECDVYEILYRYYNPEVSLAEPHKTTVNKVPNGYKIFLKLYNCQAFCRKINRKNGHND